MLLLTRKKKKKMKKGNPKCLFSADQKAAVQIDLSTDLIAEIERLAAEETLTRNRMDAPITAWSRPRPNSEVELEDD